MTDGFLADPELHACQCANLQLPHTRGICPSIAYNHPVYYTVQIGALIIDMPVGGLGSRPLHTQSQAHCRS